MKRQDVLEFKNRHAKLISNMPIFIWIAELYIEDMNRLIAVRLRPYTMFQNSL